VLVGAVLAGFALLLPVPAIRRFYAPLLPHGELATTLAAAAAGSGVLACFWVLARRYRRVPPPTLGG